MDRGWGGETPRSGIFDVHAASTAVPRQGDSPRNQRGYPQVVSLTASMHRLVAAQPATGPKARPRSWPSPIVDAAIAVVALAGSLALLAHGRGLGLPRHGGGNLDATHIALVAAATLPLLAWRRAPLAVFAATAAASLALAGIGNVIWPPLGPAAALYLYASSRQSAARWSPHGTGVAAVLLLAYLGAAVAVIGFAGNDLVHAGVACAVAWYAGEHTRLRRDQIADLQQRAARAEQDATRERQLAVAEERARIARDLHDSAGHALNVIAVRAGAARLRYGEGSGRALTALAAIEDLARETVADIDRFVGALRTSDTGANAVETPHGLASLDTLATQHRSSGLRVTIDRLGAGPIGAATDQAAYRILQEALTNAARHGTGDARITLTVNDRWLDITVTNPIDAHRPAEPDPGAGHGLVGMRERATLLGGTLTAGRFDGVFRVHARIPQPGCRV
jgi:signal transduction histidine kinase